MQQEKTLEWTTNEANELHIFNRKDKYIEKEYKELNKLTHVHSIWNFML